MATAAETQHDDAVAGDFLQRDMAAVLRQLRIDLVLDDPGHALHQRRRFGRHLALDLRCADLELAAGGLLRVIDLRAVQVLHAGRIDPDGETLAVHRPFVAAEVGRLGEVQAHVGLHRSRLLRGQAHAEPGQVLARDQLAEMRLGGF